MHSFTFNGLNSRTYCKLFVSGGGTHSAPERDIESVSVPGRNGELTIDHGRFKNIKVPYAGWIIEDVDTNIVKARNWLCSQIGYKRLSDDYYPDEFRMARLVGGIDFSVSTTTPVAATATITFDCMPQRWLVSGETAQTFNTSGNNITNPTMFPSKPLITVSGSGMGNIRVGGILVKISDIPGSIIIDCESERAYTETGGVYTPLDNLITAKNGYPTIPSGSSRVSFDNGVTGVVIIPRWWRV